MKIFILQLVGVSTLQAFQQRQAAEDMAEYFVHEGRTVRIYEAEVDSAPLTVHAPSKPPEYEGGA